MTFVIAGFPFLRHWSSCLMIVASTMGSYLGGFFRNRVPEKLGFFF